MNTAEMWIKAQIDGKIYECINGDIAYSKDRGLVDKDDLKTPWSLEAWGHCGSKGLDELMADCKWEAMKNAMTIEEAEEKFCIRIVEDFVMAKKYRYNVGLSAEDEFIGTIDLTKKEAEMVAYATNIDNWKNIQGGGYCGYFWFDVDNPMEIKD